MDYQHKPSRLLITGKSGTGKSEYFIRYVEAVCSRYTTVFVFDHEGEFSDRTGWPAARTLEELEKPKHVQCFDPIDLYPGDKQTAFEFYCDYVFQYAQCHEDRGEQFLFGCDELQKIGIDTDVLPPDLSCLVETGRRYCIDTVFIAQQCNLIHNRLRNQVTEVVTFRHEEKRALQWLCEYGFSEDELRSLNPVGEYIARTDRGQESRGNIFTGQVNKKPVDSQADKDETAGQVETDLSAPEREGDQDELEPESVSEH
jgi:hypothetical protein